ncbi:lectin-like domain-containing protein [Levilactobacillus yonginensis]|uniref:lectin-like domain-containing protein n=1 Tax=Levilactobacillus yonginensis TaxID=1054041 RepID=UPI00345D11C7
MMVKGVMIGFTSLLVASFYLFVVTAQARTPLDLKHGLATTPQGITLPKVFEAGQSPWNHATVVHSQNQRTPTTQVVQLTDDAGQVGAIWSKKDFRFNLNHRQTVSMWLYFGDGGSFRADRNVAGDGMAFVLQNGGGVQAAPKYPGKIFGESLGVWGIDNLNDYFSSAKDVAETAIQHSWALEFDTFLNKTADLNSGGKGDAFDLDSDSHNLKTPHIASNYPGEASSYVPKDNYSLVRFAQSYALLHNGVLAGDDFNFLSNAKWHHLTLTYEPTTPDSSEASMTYSFNDRDPVTGVTARSGMTATVPIDRNIIDPAHTGQAWWGFTGSTGSMEENNLVVFDEIPDLVDSEAQADLRVQLAGSAGKMIPVQAGDTLATGNKVSLSYQLRYLNGSRSWHNIEAQLRLPQRLRFNTMKIHYPDGTETDLTGTDLTQSLIRQKIETLSDNRNQATIELTGVVKDSTGPVPSTTSEFKGDEAVASTSTPEFRVQGSNSMILHLTSTANLTVDNSQSISLPGMVDLSKTQYQSGDVKIRGELNGDVQLPEQRLVASDARGAFNYKIPANTLRKGQNSLKLTAVDPDEAFSNTVTTYLTATNEPQATGALGFANLAGQADFSGKLTGNRQALPNHSTLDLQIEDSRSAGHGWDLKARLNQPLTNVVTKQPLLGDLYYATTWGNREELSRTDQIVAHGETDGSDQVIDVTAKWQQLYGLFLQVNAGAQQGIYSGSITWTLADTPRT